MTQFSVHPPVVGGSDFVYSANLNTGTANDDKFLNEDTDVTFIEMNEPGTSGAVAKRKEMWLILLRMHIYMVSIVSNNS